MRTRWRRWFGSAAALWLAGCHISTPFRGPGVERDGVATEGERVVVALTHAVLDRSKRRPFDRYTKILADGIESQPGLIGYSLGRQLFGNEVWTISAWTDRASLDAFVQSELHRAAMKAGRPAVRAMRSCELEVAAAELPLDREQAFALLDAHAAWTRDDDGPPRERPPRANPSTNREAATALPHSRVPVAELRKDS